MSALAERINDALGWRESSLRQYWRRFIEGFSCCAGGGTQAEQRRALWLELLGDQWRAWAHDGGAQDKPLGDHGSAEALASATRKWRDAQAFTALRLPAEAALVTDLLLPQAAAQNLHEVLGFEMQRRTPFSADQVYYDHQVLAAKTDNGQMRVRLFVVPRTEVDTALTQLSRAGFDLDAVTLSGEPQVNFLPTDQRRARRSSTALNLMLVGLLLALLFLALWLPLDRQRLLLDEQHERLTGLRVEASDVGQLREQIETQRSAGRFLFEKRRREPRLMLLLTELTQRIPDNTWVQNFSIRKGKVEIRGESVEAYGLIPLLEASPVFKDVKFKSTVTSNNRTKRERFHIELTPIEQGAAG